MLSRTLVCTVIASERDLGGVDRLHYVTFENLLGISQLPVVHLITELLNGSPLPKKQCPVTQQDKMENTGTIRLPYFCR